MTARCRQSDAPRSMPMAMSLSPMSCAAMPARRRNGRRERVEEGRSQGMRQTERPAASSARRNRAALPSAAPLHAQTACRDLASTTPASWAWTVCSVLHREAGSSRAGQS